MRSMDSRKRIREELVLKELAKKRKLSTAEVAELLGISECSARRFFDELERKGAANRVFGGIRLPAARGPEYRFDNVQLRRSEQKGLIGAYAGGLVDSGDVFYLDSGTTAQQMAFALVRRIQAGMLADIQVFTNSLRNLTILKGHCEVNLVGGQYRDRREDFCGYLSERVLGEVSFEKCFLGADGVCLEPGHTGVMTMDVLTARLVEIVANRSQIRYLLADSTKFIHKAFVTYTGIETIKTIITDSEMSDSVAAKIESLGPEVLRVSSDMLIYAD